MATDVLSYPREDSLAWLMLQFNPSGGSDAAAEMMGTRASVRGLDNLFTAQRTMTQRPYAFPQDIPGLGDGQRKPPCVTEDCLETEEYKKANPPSGSSSPFSLSGLLGIKPETLAAFFQNAGVAILGIVILALGILAFVR